LDHFDAARDSKTSKAASSRRTPKIQTHTHIT
jgi:hypothetical protein